MFITTVCVLFLIKLRWPMNKSLYAGFYLGYLRGRSFPPPPKMPSFPPKNIGAKCQNVKCQNVITTKK